MSSAIAVPVALFQGPPKITINAPALPAGTPVQQAKVVREAAIMSAQGPEGTAAGGSLSQVMGTVAAGTIVSVLAGAVLNDFAGVRTPTGIQGFMRTDNLQLL